MQRKLKKYVKNKMLEKYKLTSHTAIGLTARTNRNKLLKMCYGNEVFVIAKKKKNGGEKSFTWKVSKC